LPRQARDKHRERHSKKDAFLQLQGYEHKENPKLKINRTVLAEELLQCTQHNAKCQPVIIGPTALIIRARTQAKPTTCESVDADRSLHVNVADVMAASSTNRMTLNCVCCKSDDGAWAAFNGFRISNPYGATLYKNTYSHGSPGMGAAVDALRSLLNEREL
jgi:hypothetical protein